jgi:outer membrane receptor protein involved in Fe transport
MSIKRHILRSTALPILAIIVMPIAGIAHAEVESQGSTKSIVSAADNSATVQEVIVTAQKREESIQTVPIAVTALSGDSLQKQGVRNGSDLQLAVPNMTFSRASFGAVDYQIRGVGYQVVSTAADTGVGVHENNAPLIVNRLADGEFYDMQRVEVLRGPQGTLFGRNATGGVINAITAKPTDQFGGSLTAEVGNYDERKLTGFIDLPINDMLAVRIAGMGLKRDGLQNNTELGGDMDGRDLYSYRASVSFNPSSNFHADLMWEHYQEADDRFGVKFVCGKDPGPSSVGGVAVLNADARGYLSRGCLQDSIYSHEAQTGTVNTVATLTGALANLYGLVSGDANANTLQSAGARDAAESIDPSYKARSDQYQLNAEWDVTDGLKLSSLTTYSEDRLRTRAAFQDGTVPFMEGPVTPGGVFNDPQTGPSRFVNLDEDYDNYNARQWSEEVRLQSSFQGPFNFSVGGLYLHLKRFDDIYILSNASTAATEIGNLLGGNSFVDPNAAPDGSGHNYYNSRSPYTLTSTAVFGELYWQATDTIRVTLGGRYTDDKKSLTVYPVQLLNPGMGYPSDLVEQKAEFKEPTGRATVDWTPKLSFTDNTLVYASYSRGYKGGGFNAPNLVETSPTYKPEFVNAFELGTKNTLLNRTLSLNLTGFYYDYSGYQISQVQGLGEVTANVDAEIMGLEFESVWKPTRALQFNANLGYLHTRITGGESIDIFNRTQNDPSLTYLKSLTSACVGRTADVAKLIGLINSGTVPADTLTALCPTADAPNGPLSSSDPAQNPLAALGVTVPTFGGVPVQLKGKQLPNAPAYTLTLGAQYSFDLPGEWQGVLHGDFYHQAKSYTDIYNDPSNALKAWSNVNMTLSFARPQSGLEVQLYVKNLLNKAVVTGVGVDSESLGLSRSLNYLDPRLFGASVTKHF